MAEDAHGESDPIAMLEASETGNAALRALLAAKVEALARDCTDAQRELNRLKGLTT